MVQVQPLKPSSTDAAGRPNASSSLARLAGRAPAAVARLPDWTKYRQLGYFLKLLSAKKWVTATIWGDAFWATAGMTCCRFGTLSDTNLGYFSHVVGGFLSKESGNVVQWPALAKRNSPCLESRRWRRVVDISHFGDARIAESGKLTISRSPPNRHRGIRGP